MPAPTVGPVPLPGITLETWLLKYDKHGKCESPEHLTALLARLKSDPGLPVILFSHGWNNEYGDATGWYQIFLKNLQDHLSTYPGKKKPLFVGVIWPSTWLSFDRGPEIAAATVLETQVAQELAATLPEGKQQRLQTLLASAQITKEQAAELADLVASALKAQLADGETEGLEDSIPDSPALLEAMLESQQITAKPSSDQGDDLPEGGVVNSATGGGVAAAGLLSYLDPRWALRVASVYQMKDRAGTVGAKGVSSLVKDILANTPAPLHLVGHSYGAKVVLSAVAAQPLAGKVQSILLLQPAISHLCFAGALPGRGGKGGYHDVPNRVVQPVLTTYSKHDFALHELFHRALRRAGDLGEVQIAGQPTQAGNPPNVYAALGGYGPRAATERLIEPLPAPGTALNISAGDRVVGLDGSRHNRVNGHGDVKTPHTAWLLYSQLL